ncbi:MAG: serine/threonine-protein kinase, partial [Acidobacteriota bacterium]
MKSLAPNTLIQNRYLVVQLIGKGGMGEVYLAVDQRLGSAVALKRMLFSDEEALGKAFEREAKTLARLRHPALTKVSDHFNENGMQYLVMEHISGDDLSNRLEQNQKPFPLSWVLFWADQLLDALSYLHSHEPPIIHRDIKPQNLKLTGDNHIILLDFGLAKDSIGETRLSSTGNMIAYTPNYASMEQIRGTGTTARSDIYALSATMYQLLSNIVPADSLTRADSVLNNQPDPVTPLSEHNSEVSPAISGIIAKGMNLSSEQRFASAKEMQMALREAYSQYQQGMSAQTVAFNATEEIIAPPLQSGINTEQYPTPKSSEPVGAKTEVMPVSLTKEVSEEVIPVGAETPADFNATVPFGTPFSENIEVASIGEKTEVLPPEISESFGDKTQISPIDYSYPVGE